MLGGKKTDRDDSLEDHTQHMKDLVAYTKDELLAVFKDIRSMDALRAMTKCDKQLGEGVTGLRNRARVIATEALFEGKVITIKEEEGGEKPLLQVRGKAAMPDTFGGHVVRPGDTINFGGARGRAWRHYNELMLRTVEPYGATLSYDHPAVPARDAFSYAVGMSYVPLHN